MWERERERERKRRNLLALNSVKLSKIQEHDSFRHGWIQGANKVPFLCVSWTGSLHVVGILASGRSRGTLYLNSNPHEQRSSSLYLWLKELREESDLSSLCLVPPSALVTVAIRMVIIWLIRPGWHVLIHSTTQIVCLCITVSSFLKIVRRISFRLIF